MLEIKACPECGSNRIIQDDETGEACCTSCGLVVSKFLNSEAHPTNLSGNVTFHHLPDKNLPTTFMPEDVKGEARRKFLTLKRIDKICQTIRPKASTYYNVTMKVRSILERIKYPQNKMNIVLSEAAKIALNNGIQRTEKMYEALTLYALVKTDKQKYLLMGLKRLQQLISQSIPAEIGKINSWKHEGRGVWRAEWKIPDSPHIPDIWLATVAIAVNNGSASERLSISAPFKVVKNAHKTEPNRAFMRSFKSLFFSLKCDKTLYTAGEELSLTLKVMKDDSFYDGITCLSASVKSGGNYFLLKKTYAHLCASLKEKLSPCHDEDLVMAFPHLKPEEKARVCERLPEIERNWRFASLPKLSSNLKVSAAICVATRLPPEKVAPFYGVNVSTLKAKVALINKLCEDELSIYV